MLGNRVGHVMPIHCIGGDGLETAVCFGNQQEYKLAALNRNHVVYS
jgi:hypothetical protein